MKISTVESKTFESLGGSILSSALSQGLVFQYSCKTGQCGVCKVKLLEGEVVEIQDQLSLSDEEKKEGYILTCCCKPLEDIVVDAEDLVALKGVEIKTLPCRIKRIEYLSADIVNVFLKLPPAAKLNFLEGQYVDIILDEVRRSYSIASISTQAEVSLLVKKVNGGVMSDYWFNHAKLNDLLRLEGPKGTFYLRNPDSPLLFLATGTGIAPIISILQKMDVSTDFKQVNDIHVFWGNRSEGDFIWQFEFEKLNVNLMKVLSKDTLNWSGAVGYVQDLALKMLGDNLSAYDVYACGSNKMINSSKAACVEQKLPMSQFYSDAFVKS